MSPIEAEGFRSVATTLRDLAREDYRRARQATDPIERDALRILGRTHARDARRWDALAELGQA